MAFVRPSSSSSLRVVSFSTFWRRRRAVAASLCGASRKGAALRSTIQERRCAAVVCRASSSPDAPNDDDEEDRKQQREEVKQEGDVETGDDDVNLEDLPVLGESRFDYQVRALRGEFSPEDEETEDTEENGSGRIMSALSGGQWPQPYKFQVVARSTGVWVQDERLARDVVATVSRLTLGSEGAISPIDESSVTVKLRGSKFLSVNVDVEVESQEDIDSVLQALGEDDRIIMRY
uniref:Uncharacterized protein n=1 Tax=Pycnococcus provasolii TaxID=41880 RepID=A0A7S2BKT2_9CHLO|mmetsp:Transcript_9976/g.22607  ORF Transcript_9976/g.22607 Transcript_9976/m.22607 type:complete len:234 (+) Transcript_9976:37-738(+)